MKRLIIPCVVLLCAGKIEAAFTAPFGATLDGAGSTLGATYLNNLINAYNKSYPCPTIVYKQKPASIYAGSQNGVLRALDDTVTFGVSIDPLSSITLEDAPDCILQIPFTLASLSIIYNLPSNFGPGTANPANGNWPNHLNIAPFDLCQIYTASAASQIVPWGTPSMLGLLNRLYNGAQIYTGGSVLAFARADSSDETSLLVQYLQCSKTTPLNVNLNCDAFITAANVTTNPSGPFCNTNPGRWGSVVSCVSGGSDAIARAVAMTPGSIGYVGTDVAYDQGFFPIPTANGIPKGVAGLFIQGSTNYTSPQQDPQQNPANYTLPVSTAVQAAVTDCVGGRYLCEIGAYPIVDMELFILNATHTDDIITCNIRQFIQFALTVGQDIPGGFAAPASGCLCEGIAQLDKLSSAICEPCVRPCNPCLNQPCPPLPSCIPCKC